MTEPPVVSSMFYAVLNKTERFSSMMTTSISPCSSLPMSIPSPSSIGGISGKDAITDGIGYECIPQGQLEQITFSISV
jgi:hypothetical protein